jgi:flagellar hook protein FlgE
MGFQHGLTGLAAASKTLEVIGNNVANANTVGFKQSQAQFADVYASSLSGTGMSQVGIGTSVAAVAQSFTQGNITSTNNPLDIAINGGGFFGLRMDGATTNYGRNGQFHLDRDGYIVNGNGARLQGYMPDTLGIPNGSPRDIQISDNGDDSKKATSAVKMELNLNFTRTPPTVTPFSPTDPLTYNESSSVTVYDSRGTSHLVQMYFVKTDTGWDVHTTNDVTQPPPDPLPSVLLGSMTFNPDGTLNELMKDGAAVRTLTLDAIPVANAEDLVLDFDFGKTSEYGSAFAVNSLEQNGYAAGDLAGLATQPDGTIIGRYTNGRTVTLGQIALYHVADPNAMRPLGNNVWADTAASGYAVAGKPGTGKLGVLQSSSVEDSNVDLTAELVNMITAQRVYQANTQTIKTQDQVLQSLLNLR